MAEQADRTHTPDFTNMSVPERSEWLLTQLRGLPGTTVMIQGERWLQLETTGSLVPVLAELAPGLTDEQLKLSSRWMGDQGLRTSKNMGGGEYMHRVKLAPESGNDAVAPAATDDSAGELLPGSGAQTDAAGGTKVDAADAALVLERAAAELTALRAKVLQLAREKADLIVQNTQLARENTELDRRLKLVAPLQDGLEKLREALGEEHREEA